MLDQAEVRRFEGRRVGVGLDNGTRIDDPELVSGGRASATSLWLCVQGIDVFIPYKEVMVLWEADGHSD